MNAFETKLNGPLQGVMHWRDWDALRARLTADGEARWHAYAVGEALPEAPLPMAAFKAVLAEIDALLRRDHGEDYLGIVYVDDPWAPTLVKIYDPNHLGSACGSIGYKVQPGWVLSVDAPRAIEAGAPLPGNRRRWWASLGSRLFSA